MIVIKRNEDIDVFQVELALKLKTKQSPFISILILAQEQKVVSAYSLQQNLLSSLPLKACENLLKRLEQQGYLKKEQNNMFGYSQTYQNSFANYVLTDIGRQSAMDKSFWIGEKGVYNVYISKTNLIEQQIIRTEKVERAEDNRYSNIIGTPKEIRQYENQILNINKTEVLIEDVEDNCFQLKSVNCILEIHVTENESLLKISKESQLLFQTALEIEENLLQEELLVSCSEFHYDQDKKAILSEFNKDNLSFKRNVKISKPIFGQNLFNHVEIEGVYHIPSNQENADLWYWELLYKNLNEYFLDENSFIDYASQWAKPFQMNFNLKIPNRKELSRIFYGREDAFYQIAKLETIDYLNY